MSTCVAFNARLVLINLTRMPSKAHLSPNPDSVLTLGAIILRSLGAEIMLEVAVYSDPRFCLSQANLALPCNGDQDCVLKYG